MVDDEAELKAALSRTALAARSIASIPIRDTPASALLVEIDPTEVLAAWQTARALVAGTGRWPVAMTAWGSGGAWSEAFRSASLFSAFGYQQEPGAGADLSPRALIEAARTVDLEAGFAKLQDRLPEDSEAAMAQSEAAADDAVYTDHIDWFVPQGQSVALVLLPTPHGSDALAYHSWFGAETVGTPFMIALLQSWHQRYGAELVAHWGTMLQLVVQRRPADMTEALQLAREQILVAPCTTELPGATLRDHAHALMKSDRWFLHERP